MKKMIVGGLAASASLLMVGGTALATPPFNYNSDENWSEVLGLDCVKFEAGDLGLGDDTKSWIADMDYAAVVAKGGSVDSGSGPGIVVYENVMAGDEIMPPLNSGGQQAAISWLMFCEGDGYPLP